jgi:hypothetical protein
MLSAVDAPSGISPREELAPAVLSNLTGSEAARRGPHHLLVVEGDERRLLALCVRPRGAAGVAVSVSCVRTTATAEAGPWFTSMLWAQVPAPVSALPDGKGRPLVMEAEVASCAVPGEMVLYVRQGSPSRNSSGFPNRQNRSGKPVKPTGKPTRAVF